MFCSQISSPRLLEDKVSGGHTCASVDPVCVCAREVPLCRWVINNTHSALEANIPVTVKQLPDTKSLDDIRLANLIRSIEGRLPKIAECHKVASIGLVSKIALESLDHISQSSEASRSTCLRGINSHVPNADPLSSLFNYEASLNLRRATSPGAKRVSSTLLQMTWLRLQRHLRKLRSQRSRYRSLTRCSLSSLCRGVFEG